MNREKKDTIMDLESRIKYEKHKGVHTYHNCPCGRNSTRAGTCWECLEEELKVLTTQAEKGRK